MLARQQFALELLDDPLWQAANGLRKLLRWFWRGVRQGVQRLAQKLQPAPYDGDLIAWGQHFLPHYFQAPPSKMHIEIAALLDEQARQAEWREEREKGSMGEGESNASNLSLSPRLPFSPSGPLKLNILAPRGSAKSTLVTLTHVLREAVTARQPYIWIVSDTRHQAMSHLENLRAELNDNDEIHKFFPHVEDSISRGNRITLLNNVQIEAFGAGQRLRGKRFRQHRPTLIVCDDLQNDGHMASARQRDRSRNWFHSMLLKAGTKRTQFINLGTALHRKAIAIQLQNTPGWTSRKFQAIEEWPTNMQLWAEWEERYRGQNSVAVEAPKGRESADKDAQLPSKTPTPADSRPLPRGQCEDVPTNLTRSPLHPFTRSSSHQLALDFYNEHHEAMQAGATLLWPEVEDLHTLMQMRAESGSAVFEREKQCVPMNPEECEWPESYFSGDIWFSEWPSDLRLKTLALDPSKGTDAKHGDYSAFVMLGLANDGTFYIEANLARRPTPQIVTDGVELIRHFKPQGFGVETNQFQSLLADEFARELKRQHLFTINGFKLDNRTAKIVRIRRLGPLLANRQFKFKTNSPGTNMLIEQLREFPVSRHDDGPDALEMALQVVEMLLRPVPNDGLGNRLI